MGSTEFQYLDENLNPVGRAARDNTLASRDTIAEEIAFQSDAAAVRQGFADSAASFLDKLMRTRPGRERALVLVETPFNSPNSFYNALTDTYLTPEQKNFLSAISNVSDGFGGDIGPQWTVENLTNGVLATDTNGFSLSSNLIAGTSMNGTNKNAIHLKRAMRNTNKFDLYLRTTDGPVALNEEMGLILFSSDPTEFINIRISHNGTDLICNVDHVDGAVVTSLDSATLAATAGEGFVIHLSRDTSLASYYNLEIIPENDAIEPLGAFHHVMEIAAVGIFVGDSVQVAVQPTIRFDYLAFVMETF